MKEICWSWVAFVFLLVFFFYYYFVRCGKKEREKKKNKQPRPSLFSPLRGNSLQKLMLLQGGMVGSDT